VKGPVDNVRIPFKRIVLSEIGDSPPKKITYRRKRPPYTGRGHENLD
jgi:hypothetical protein